MLRDASTSLRPVVAAHARITSRDQVVADRRALYRLALALVGADRDGPVPDHVVDDPAVRYAVGEVLGGRADPRGLRAVVGASAPRACGPAVVRDAATARVLAPALAAVAQEAGGTAPGLIVDGDPRFPRVADEVAAGLDHARALLPELYADLVGHVALVGILDPEHSGAVVSASSRVMPGVILLRPGGPLEVAESVVHEAAHQRLFDLALTRDMLRADADGDVGCRPSWRTVTWPREQTLAAFHAYACLAELRAALPGSPALAPHSVLPAAAVRARELGEWLFARPDLLGADAGRLVAALLGRPAPIGPGPADLPAGRSYRAGPSTVVPTAEERCLVGLPGAVPRLFWLDVAAAAVLEILREAGEAQAGEIVARYAARSGPGDPFPPVANALETLVLAELATSSAVGRHRSITGGPGSGGR